jgi:apolipoprotein N-acyltransferase
VKPTALVHTIVLSYGWRRSLIAFAAGALSALAMAPLTLWPVLFLTLPTLVWLIDGAGADYGRGLIGAAATGWWFGFGYFLAGLYWVGFAFLVDAPTFGWLLPFAVVGLPAGLAIFTAFGVAAARLLWTGGAMRILALGVALTAAEWLRGHVLSGFPWNTFGYALTSPLILAQSASVVGIWGLTFIAVVVFASPATLADDRTENRWRALPLTIGIVVLAAMAAFGALRLARTPTRLVDGIALRIMQPNLQQDVRFNYAAKRQVMDRYIDLSGRPSTAQPVAGEPTHLIWPESAFPFFLSREPDALAQIAKLLRGRTVLITGAVRLAEPVASSDLGVYNSIYVIGPDGSLDSFYDKTHLVPFGEYLPFQQFLESLGLQQLTKQRGGFLAGDRRRLIAVPGAPLALPLICYEIIFPGDLMPKGPRPGWIVNVTNDGWFGISSGPYQHFQQARLRAIEQGLPLVRAANTGISAVVDPVGRIVDALPLGTEGVIDAPLPRPIGAPIYARIGDGPATMIVAVALLALVWRRLQPRVPKIKRRQYSETLS